MLYGISLTGHYNYSDVAIYNNRFYAPNITMTGMFKQEFGDEIIPQNPRDNEIHDATGRRIEHPYAQGNITGAVTFTAGNGPIQTSTLTGNVTATLSNGYIVGQSLERRFTMGGAGSYTYTKAANEKLAGGSFTPTAAVGSVDTLITRWDGTNWREVRRSLNES
jgi:hypothetical protein